MVDTRELLTSAEAAQVLGVSHSRVRQLVNNGELHGVKRAERWFFERSEVERCKRVRQAALEKDGG